MAAAHAYASINEDEHLDMETIGANLDTLMSEAAPDRTRIAQSLSLLKAAMLLHFAHEETLMKEANYPNLFHHRRSHTYIVNEISVFIAAFVAGREATTNDIWPHLKKTLDTHIVRYDNDLCHFLTANP
ncbi:MAG: hemerythrin domain-containing protein [Rhodospirillaceae bacterium]